MPTVLVVDDSEVDRRLAGGLLERNLDVSVEYAASGAEALAQMEHGLPNLLVTDLRMPDMTGLELVTTSRLQYPDVPVLLMTAHGSETLAIEALEQGAAGYVAKSHLADKLVEAVSDVLAVARADSSFEQLIGCLERTEFVFHLQNDPMLIEPLVDLVQSIVAGQDLCDFTDRVRIGVAMREALLNAMLLGNLQLDVQKAREIREQVVSQQGSAALRELGLDDTCGDRKVAVDIRIGAQEACFVIRDGGAGFDVASLPNRDDPHALSPDAGRGIWLMRSFMDEVVFNEAGNEVTLIKRRTGEG
jgi:CheY-like chemotaxis protein